MVVLLYRLISTASTLGSWFAVIPGHLVHANTWHPLRQQSTMIRKLLMLASRLWRRYSRVRIVRDGLPGERTEIAMPRRVSPTTSH